MNLIERIRNILLRKKAEPSEPEKKCLGCGKMFPYNPSWEYIPNYCRDCKERFDQVQESLLRGGKPRNIRRKCRSYGGTIPFFQLIATLSALLHEVQETV